MYLLQPQSHFVTNSPWSSLSGYNTGCSTCTGWTEHIRTTDTENKPVVTTSGEGQPRGRGSRGTNYYVHNKQQGRMVQRGKHSQRLIITTHGAQSLKSVSPSSHCAAQILLPRHSDQVSSPSGNLPWFSHTTSLELNVYLSPTILQRHISPNVVNSQLSTWTFLVVQWFGICLLMQETQALSPVWEDPTCSGATNPGHHNCFNPHLEAPLHNKRSPRGEPPQQGGHSAAKVSKWPVYLSILEGT